MKIFWYLNKLFRLCVVSVRLLLYCLIKPKKIGILLFSIFSSINEFYQVSHGKLRNFYKTQTCQDMCKQMIFAKTNVFNADSKVTRNNETLVLSALVCAFNPKTIFEIGTYNGYTTFHFAKNSSEDCEIYTLDLPPDFDIKNKKKDNEYSYDDLLVVKLSMENIDKRIYKNYPEKEKIKELFGDSMTFDYSPYYGKMDMVFIDGNHSYEFVKSDTEHAFKLLSENGVIVWHDFDYIIHRDVFKYLNQLAQEHEIYSIPHTRFAIYGKTLK